VLAASVTSRSRQGGALACNYMRLYMTADIQRAGVSYHRLLLHIEQPGCPRHLNRKKRLRRLSSFDARREAASERDLSGSASTHVGRKFELEMDRYHVRITTSQTACIKNDYEEEAHRTRTKASPPAEANPHSCSATMANLFACACGHRPERAVHMHRSLGSVGAAEESDHDDECTAWPQLVSMPPWCESGRSGSHMNDYTVKDHRMAPTGAKSFS